MSFKIEQRDNYEVIKFSTDKLDAIVAPDLKAELVLASKKGAKNIIIDLESVRYCDSSGLSALLIGRRLCKELGGSFILTSLQPSVQKLIIISQLDSILTIKSSIEAALKFDFMAENDQNLGTN